MPKLKIYAIQDSKVGVYMMPHFFQTEGQAIRAWIDMANNKGTMVGKHPGDYTLFELGHFDEDTGRFDNNGTPVSKGVASEYIQESQLGLP